MFRIKYTVISILVGLIAAGALAVPSEADTVLDSLTYRLAMDAPTKEDYPDAKSAILWAEKKITLDENGYYTIEWRTVQKVLTFMGKKELSNIKYKYDSDFQEAEITRARSITRDGDSSFSVVVVDSLQINDITLPGLADAGIYASVKQRVVTIPAMSESSVVDIGGVITTNDRPKKPFGGMEILGSELPIKHYRMTIEVPEGMRLKYKSANGAPEPIIENNVYIWNLENYEGILAEPAGPLGRNRFPAVYYTINENWNIAADYVRARFMPKLVPTDEITAKANEITGSMTGRDAVDTLTSWVARNIRMIDLDISDAGYIPNDAKVTLSNGYGDVRDRCVLLGAMLKSRGIEPRIALLPPSDARVVSEVPTLEQFKRTVVVMPDYEGGENLWLWTEDDYTPAGILPHYDGEKALLVSATSGKLVDLPDADPAENGFDQEYFLTMNGDGDINGRIKVVFTGNYQRGIRSKFRDASPRRVKQGMESLVSNIGDGVLDGDEAYLLSYLDDNNSNPEIEIEFKSEDYAFIQDDMMIFNFPEDPVMSSDRKVPTSLDERDEPMVLEYPYTESYGFTVEVPEEYEVVWVSEPISVSNDAGRISVSSEVDDNLVKYSIVITILKTWYSPEEYDDIKDLMRAYRAPKNRMILLEKKQIEQE